ncbi:MAG: imidazolonepropionase [Acidimicrobiia bacterium]
MSDLLISNIGQLVTNAPGHQGPLGTVDDAAVAVRHGTIAWVGESAMVPPEHRDLPRLDADGHAVVPGFIDPHTHVVFAGDRAHEHAMRLAGASYEAIQEAGGGIYATVIATREASLADLVLASHTRVARMLASGTTTVEVKTGYGLDTATETKMLDAIDAIDASLPIDIVRTFLGAHVVAPEFAGDRGAYVDLVADEMLNAVADRVDFVDVFCDSVAFTVAETRRILEAARTKGLRVRLHADQLSHTGGAALAAEVGAVAADHLDFATDADLVALARSGTVAVLLPGVSLTMVEPPPDGRRFIDAGVTVALATDCNPGTSYVETMPFIVALAATTSGLTPEEALWSATAGGAVALGLKDRGVIAAGKLGDLVMLDAASYEHLVYRPDGDLVRRVIKRGVVL